MRECFFLEKTTVLGVKKGENVRLSLPDNALHRKLLKW